LDAHELEALLLETTVSGGGLCGVLCTTNSLPCGQTTRTEIRETGKRRRTHSARWIVRVGSYVEGEKRSLVFAEKARQYVHTDEYHAV